MNISIQTLQEICRNLKGVSEDIKWEDHLCFNVGGKMFLVTAPDMVPPTASFKVPAEEFEELLAKPGFSPAQYLARYKWVYLDDINRLNKKEWEYFIQQSYNAVLAKLPKKTQVEISLQE